MQRRQPASFLAAYAIAWAGGSIAYTPFLTVLLPMRFTALAGVGDVGWLALCATIGAIAAGLSNILWGWVSDRWPAAAPRRLAWSAAGVVALAAGVALIVGARRPGELLLAVAAWQIGLNLLLAPLSAYAADCVDDAQKGVLGGLLAFAPALAAVSVIAIASAGGDFPRQMLVIFAIVLAALVPLYLHRRVAPLGREGAARAGPGTTRLDRKILLRLWFARLFVQVAEGLLFLFVFYYLRSVSGGVLSLSDYAWTNAGVQLLAVPVAIVIGRLSDRTQQRKAPLLAMVGLIALGLAGMALSHAWVAVIGCYALFLCGSNSFLALHSAFAMQQLPDPRHFGRDLGLFNLTNTLPSLISPVLAALVIGQFGYSTLLMILAAMMVVPALLLSRLAIR